MQTTLLNAAEAALSGKFTWASICDATDSPAARMAILRLFRRYFASDTRWPDDDCETRCLAFLLLREVTAIPSVSPLGFLSEYFLECQPDGVIRVKDGRSLECYINDPRLVERRKGKSSEMAICSASVFEAGLFPPCA